MRTQTPPLALLLVFLGFIFPSIIGAATADALSEPAANAVLTVSIPTTPVLPNPGALSASTHAVLTTAHRAPLIARLDRRSRCIFPAVPPGSYLLEVWSREYAFEAVRVDVGENEGEGGDQAKAVTGVPIEAFQTFLGNAWSNKGPQLGRGVGSLEIAARPKAAKQYYQQRQGFNVGSLLSNPMILIGIVGLGMMVGMPKLLENMDPEMRAEFEEQQRKSPIAGGMAGGGNPLSGFDMAAWMAGSGTNGGSGRSEGAAAGGGSGADVSGSGGGGGKARKR